MGQGDAAGRVDRGCRAAFSRSSRNTANANRLFRSGITRRPARPPEERDTYERRVGIERVVFCLFPCSDSAKVAPQDALDADIEPDWQGMPEMPRREAKFIDRLLADLPKPWLAPI